MGLIEAGWMPFLCTILVVMYLFSVFAPNYYILSISIGALLMYNQSRVRSAEGRPTKDGPDLRLVLVEMFKEEQLRKKAGGNKK
jgi:hypothetical protein